jgi:CRISPR-associated helicase Cas3/CRISPR-associated endonuclease Cas3-HD
VNIIKYYAHSSDNLEKPWQTMTEHLYKTAQISKVYAAKFNGEGFGYIVGLLHDLGKYSVEFQQRLNGSKISVDHASAGAQEAMELFGQSYGKLLAYIIAGHHSGLPDHGTDASMDGTLAARLSKEIKDYSAYKKELELELNVLQSKIPINQIDEYIGFSISFFVRMLYSCLVDADFIDTERYMSDVAKLRGEYISIPELTQKINSYLSGFKSVETKINKKRGEILQRCLNLAKSDKGLYTLTVPTGGGKTYSSLAFALNHAEEHNLERIIYVIPYTSIIEQNAKVFKKVLGGANVLEHHSNYQFDKYDLEEDHNATEKLKLSSENWDIPIIVTTNVQFFESLFSNRSSKCRKIHNMAKSVIIFDEAQMLPIEYLRPCLLAICELVKNYKSTAILCTATQPAINNLLPKSMKPTEIMENPKQLYNDFKKVQVVMKGDLDDDELADELNQCDQVLCIVNTRKHAKEIFNKLDGEAFHLSTLMCPIHRQETLATIRQMLKGGEPCKVVSTQLIEAGVDVDFPVVYRAIAGVDSIVQSAGRCNREGLLPVGNVYVFRPVSEFAKVKGYLETTSKISDMVFRRYDDPISLEAIEYYFKLLYDLEGEARLDNKDVLSCFEENYSQLEFDFKTAADRFKLIESNTYSIVIPYNEEAIDLLNQAKYTLYPRSLARKLQPYTVSIYEYEYKALIKNTAVTVINDSFIVLDSFPKEYDQKTGLKIPKDIYGEAIFV